MEEDDAYDAAVPTRIRSLPVAAGAGIDNSTDAWPRSLEASLGMLSGTPPRSLPSALIRRMSSSVRTGSVDWQALSALPSGSGAQQDLAGTLDGVDESGELQEQLLYDFEEAPSSNGYHSPHTSPQHKRSVEQPLLRYVSTDTMGTHATHTSSTSYALDVEVESGSSLWQAGFNAANILCGVGLLTTPYAMAISGISSLALLVMIGGMACYTGWLLSVCMAQGKGSIRTYPQIGYAAFGNAGRLLVCVLLYLELFCCCVDFIILEADNLSAVFPHAIVGVLGWTLSAKQTMLLASAIVVLPTVWLRDMSLLSYISVGGIFASGALIGLVGWEGAAEVGFKHTAVPLVDWSGVPLALGLYCFCFSGHAVFPSLYSSMKNKAQFPWLLVCAFSLVVIMYGTMAVLGVLMFGSSISENITLDMQRAASHAVPTRLAMWLVIINPLTKLGLTLAPVAMALEELIVLPVGSKSFMMASMGIRTLLLLAVVATALLVPFFSLVMAFIGSVMSMSISIVLPCVFALKLGVLPSRMGALAACFVAAFGVVAGCVSTYESVVRIVKGYD